MKGLTVAAFAVCIGALPQDEDPARWITLLSSKQPAERDEAFIRLLRLGDKATGALKAAEAKDAAHAVRARDLLWLIERREDRMPEILSRARDEAGYSMERFLWRAHHIGAFLCEDREWRDLKPVFDKAGWPEWTRSRGQFGDSLTYSLMPPAWTTKSGAKFELHMKFDIDPEVSFDEPTRILMDSVRFSLRLQSGTSTDSLTGAGGLPRESAIRAGVEHPAEEGGPHSRVTHAVIEFVSRDKDETPMDWRFCLWIDLKNEKSGHWIGRRIDISRCSGELRDLRVDSEQAGEGGGGGQRGVCRIDPPYVREPDESDRLKPADYATAYGPGDLKTLPESIRGLVLSGEGILQRDFDRIARFRGLTYLELDDWNEGRRVRLDVLKELPDIEAIKLHNLFRADVKHVLKLKRLKAISIMDCARLREEDFVQLAEMPALISLDLSDCPGMSDRVLRTLAKRKQLRQLEWWGGTLTSEGFQQLGQLEELRCLEVHRIGGLTPGDFEPLTRLKNLRELIMGSCGVDDDVMAVLGRIRSLRVVWLYNAKEVTDAGVMHMSSLPDLQYMNVDSSALTKKGMDALREKLPGKWIPD